jgi:hypothetical protein
MKQCTKCKTSYDLNLFPKDNSKKDGYKSYCFPCNRQVINKSTTKRKEKRHDENIKSRDNISKYNKEYYKNNKKVFQNNYKKYLQTNPTFKIIHNTRVRINKALKTNSKYSSAEELLGCSLVDYKVYLEQQFTPEMNWGNYGSYWDIDHIKSCYSFDLSSLEEQKKCFIFTNTRPLSKIENQRKNKY